MILDRASDDEPLIPGERTKIRLEMMRKKEIKKWKKEESRGVQRKPSLDWSSNS